jgi:hypothetical protein
MRHWISAAVLTTLALAPAGHAQSEAETTFAERTLAISLHTRCDLFSDAEKAALEAARLQARGVLLRNGTSVRDLQRFTGDIGARADTVSCDDPQTLEIQARVVDAFAAYRLIPDMNFPAETFTWEADRTALLAETDWVVVQDTAEVRVGIAGIDGEFLFTITPMDANRYSAAILILRDTERERDIYDPTADGLFDGPSEAPWARWTPPDHALRTIWAQDRITGDVIEPLTGVLSGIAFRYSDAAAIALSQLDPRETARIDFLDERGELAVSHYIEVGDFGAALAFLQAVLPEDQPRTIN